jgi:scyllo-inositol 2-dehydrogenase (NADP+)
MAKRLLVLAGAIILTSTVGFSQGTGAKTRLAVVGLDHDHVWGLLQDIAKEPNAELVAIADSHPELVERAKGRIPSSVKFYSDYVKMLDEMKPDAAIVTTENDKHLEILRECAKRHVNFSVEKPMATNAADSRQMARIAKEAGIKLMVNYWNVWVAPTHQIFRRVYRGDLGPVQKIIVEYGHQGPKEIGVSKYFADWLYNPVKNGGGAIVDFGCYGAEWALWLKGRPSRVYAYTLKLKTGQHNAVDDDAVILLEYLDATAVLLPSWDWPYDKGQVQVFGPKGSLLATSDQLLFRPAGSDVKSEGLDGKPVELKPMEHATSNPISYLVDCIRNNKPIEPPLTPELNVQVVEILDAARESIRTGHAVALAP